MIKLLNILRENKILIPRRSKEERQKNYLIAIEKKIQQYIKDGSKGDLNLRNAPIKSLGNLTSVGDTLNLSDTPIESLGNLTSVGGNLYLKGTPIKSLGNLTSVGGDLYLWGTPLSNKYTEEEIRQMVDVGGEIYL